ncbi:MAG: hypothetical protein LBK18_05530 [Prevotellaceae bacterium]|jgi:hypothetical protein|nr:hypothetical protein [Prevotellaceae bacterium]
MLTITMFRKIAAISLLFALCLSTAVGKQKVAVYVTGNNNSSENKIIGSKLVAAITNDGYYEAVERTAAFLGQLKKEQQYQQSGNVADDQLSKLGRQFGVDMVCIAEVVPVARAFFITARLVNVETASVEATADVTCDNVRDIQAIVISANDLAEKLLNPEVTPKAKPAASRQVSAARPTQQSSYRSSEEVVARSPQRYVEPTSFRRSPGLSFLFSLLVPGAGQFYNGQYVKGGIMAGVWIGSIIGINASSAESYSSSSYNNYYYEDTGNEEAVAIFAVLLAADYIWSIIDAPVCAKRVNRKNGYLSWNLGEKSTLSLQPDLKQTPSFGLQNHATLSCGMSLSLNF